VTVTLLQFMIDSCTETELACVTVCYCAVA